LQAGIYQIRVSVWQAMRLVENADRPVVRLVLGFEGIGEFSFAEKDSAP
jgi:hypothetical protein